jgi:pimeloyl-ACP methyl ester carboxylesterase
MKCLLATFLVTSSVVAEEWKPIPRVLPPMGIKLPDADRRKIETADSALAARIKAFAQSGKPVDLLPDVEIYEKAARFALLDQEFYSEKDVAVAMGEIATGNRRLDELEAGKPQWPTQHGQFVRGYRSEIDGTVEPYGLEIPDDLDLTKPMPLYVWLHGRGDKDTDLNFIHGREGRKGQIHPADAIVLHAYGRSCLGFKSAGETDVFEAIAAAERAYPIDQNRMVLMGFSMGGAGAWHLGAHYADRFCAVHAGAGFVDVVKYQHVKPENFPAWYEQKLWGDYDVPDYVRNLFNVPMVAYGGEIDPQRASSEIMAEAFKAEGHELTRIVGPKMPHKYDPASLADIMRRMDDAVKAGRNQFPKTLSLQTRTLRYNKMFWASLTELTEHWLDSRLDADAIDATHINITTKNVAGFSLTSPWADLGADRQIEVRIDGEAVLVPVLAFRDKGARFHKTSGRWTLLTEPSAYPPGTLVKSPGLQGPIDDIFMTPFLVVTPSAPCASEPVQKWVDFELRHFHDRWRATFRGELRMKKDTDVTAADIAKYNLVLWGDRSSNGVIAKVIGRIPMKTRPADPKTISVTGKPVNSMLVTIYPNPLNPSRYIVLNSGPTFREANDHTNSLQNPKLPDWALLDISEQPDGKSAGKVLDAGFYDESWQVKNH